MDDPQVPSVARKRYTLDFRTDAVSGKKATSSYGSNISGLAAMGRTLFCASDEETSVERLDFDERSETFLRHRSYSLAGLFDGLPSDNREADIEGLAIDDQHLWITGSHSLKRSVDDTAQSLDEFKKPKWDTKRALLGRVPIVWDKDERPTLAKTDGQRRSAMMDIGTSEDDCLRGLLKGDRLLGEFVGLPSKENGLDVEGLAVSNGAVVLGLRGPVIASFAFLVTLTLVDGGDGILVPKPINRKLYRLQAIHLDGLGIRDLLFHDKSLLVLAGPTQKTESFQRIYVVDDFFASGETITPNDRRLLMTLPMASRGDHAEGMTFFTEKSRMRLLVAYDSPTDERWDEKVDRLIVDAFNLP